MTFVELLDRYNGIDKYILFLKRIRKGEINKGTFIDEINEMLKPLDPLDPSVPFDRFPESQLTDMKVQSASKSVYKNKNNDKDIIKTYKFNIDIITLLFGDLIGYALSNQEFNPHYHMYFHGIRDIYYTGKFYWTIENNCEKTLHDYRSILDKSSIYIEIQKKLIQRFVQIYKALKILKVYHGDIHDQNLMFCPNTDPCCDKLKLMDWDLVYIPDMNFKNTLKQGEIDDWFQLGHCFFTLIIFINKPIDIMNILKDSKYLKSLGEDVYLPKLEETAYDYIMRLEIILEDKFYSQVIKSIQKFIEKFRSSPHSPPYSKNLYKNLNLILSKYNIKK
jgi:hypothetical protein